MSVKRNLLLIIVALVCDWIALFGAAHYGFIVASRWTLLFIPLYGVAVGLMFVIAGFIIGYIILTALAVLDSD